MIVIKLPEALNIDISLTESGLDNKDYKFIAHEIETELKKTKSLLDEPYKNPTCGKIMRFFESFNKEKHKLAKHVKNYNISNAWLKCYELLYRFKLIPTNNTSSFVHFANAELPGSFICATHHYASTITKVRYIWYASSLVSGALSHTKNALDDYYGLYKYYPNRWLVDSKHDGDTTKLENLDFYRSKIGNKIDLYTSDVGFDVSSDYNNQELAHLEANIGQILCGLMLLKEGGSMITKQYTFFNKTNICMLAWLSVIFTDVYITKPLTSKPDNSEVYIVAKNMTKNKFYQPFVEALRKMLESKNFDAVIPEEHLSKEFIDVINYATKKIYQKQIDKIKLNIGIYREVEKLTLSVAIPKALDRFKTTRENDIKKFYHDNKFKPLSFNLRLKMDDAYRQIKQ